MNYYITTDTHFGHHALMKYCGRPSKVEDMILKRHTATVSSADILIHLGDICIGNDAEWHRYFNNIVCFRKWLIKGNHDKKTNTWYLNHGWDAVCDTMSLRLFGLNILLSHSPKPLDGHDYNIHGHFHNSDHRRHEPELSAVQTDRHILVKLEHSYTPVNLRKLVEK